MTRQSFHAVLSWSNQPAGRVALAIGISLLLHVILLFGPKLIMPAPVEVPLPPLTARLEPLPALKPAPKPVHKPKLRIHEKPVIPHEIKTTKTIPAVAATDVEPQTETSSAESVAAQSAPVQTPPVAIPAEIPAAPVEKPAHPLPRHAELTFIVYKGADLPIGEVRHRLDISDDKHYTLQVSINTTGLARLFKTFVMSQQSTGTITASGIRPDKFSETKLTSKGKEALSADFDWQNKQLNFSSGNSSALPEQAQDILSFLYQFSQMSLDQTTLSLHVSNGKKLEDYQVEVGPEENVQTRMGLVRALPLRKIHAPGEEGLEIWLGLEYRLLPVKIRQIDRQGRNAGELVVSDIRVSDE